MVVVATVPQEKYQLPDHVPASLFWDHNIDAFARERDDPYISLARMHDGPDIVWARGSVRNRPAWVLTRHDLIQEVFLAHERFSSINNSDTQQLLDVTWRLNPVEFDPPEHMAYRLVLQPWFQPSAINALDTRVRTIARDLLATLENRDSCEFISEFASLFPSYIFLELMGMPREELPRFMEWETLFFRGTTPEGRVRGARGIKDYLEAYVTRRRSDPRDDLVSAILASQVKGRPLTDGEVMGICMNLYLGGLDTVLSSLGWYFRHLARDQALQTRLRNNPDDIPGAVDDFLRAYGVTATRRTVRADLEFHGVFMKAGDWVVLPTYLAGRDPRQYANPHEVDPARNARHLTLATGVHNCLGIHLAKREIRIVLEEWLSRFRNIRIPEGEKASWHTEGVWGVSRLPLLWERA